jgi:hypothetical protein
VTLDVARAFLAKGVVVLFYGYEKTRFLCATTAAAADGDPAQPAAQLGAAECKGLRELFRRMEKVYAYEGVYTPGTKTFEFRFQLPLGLPGTFEQCGSPPAAPEYSAKVVYKIIAFVDDGAVGQERISDVAKFVVNERFTAAPVPSKAKEVRDGSQAFKGGIQVKASLAGAVYFPGERVLVRIVANSMGKKATRKATVTLAHTVVLHAAQETEGGGMHTAAGGQSESPPLPPPPHMSPRLQQTQQQPAQSQSSKEIAIRTELFKVELPGFTPCFYGERWVSFDLPASPRVTLPSSVSGMLV